MLATIFDSILVGGDKPEGGQPGGRVKGFYFVKKILFARNAQNNKALMSLQYLPIFHWKVYKKFCYTWAIFCVEGLIYGFAIQMKKEISDCAI